MADKNFFDLLKDKMAALRPSEKHRDDDWASLGERLNAALPQQPQGKRRSIVIPLLLITALLSSNAMWWQSSRTDQASLTRLEVQMLDLKASITALGGGSGALQYKVVHDTLWQTVYVRPNEVGYAQSARNEKSRLAVSKTSQEDSFQVSYITTFLPMLDNESADKTHSYSEKTSNIISLDKQSQAESDSILEGADLALAEHSALTLPDTSKSALHSPESLALPIKEKIPTKPFSKKLTDALRPKFFKVGLNLGWLYANSTGLMHEGGFLYNLHGEIGLSRHWSVMANVGKGQLHYKAHTPEAILGSPDFPMLPSMEHHLTEMDVTGQKIHEFSLGLRYTFAQPGKPRPFLGLGWGGQTLLPFTIEYEIQHEPTGTVQKETLEVTTRTRMKNILGLSAGVVIPLSPRFDLSLEGFYQRSWKKPSGITPDLLGIQAGMNLLF
ncbi:MAG: hypothetical protein J0M29_13655 [Chitinophagales bacterium]|nr:hypothetical protein [Chitinophagales bacterium]